MQANIPSPPRPHRWIALGILLTAGFMNLVDVTIVNVALPNLQNGFQATATQIEWVVAGYILSFTLMLLPCGRLGDIVGRKSLFIAGLGIFILGSMLCGVASDMEWLILARMVQGAGAGMMIPQTLAFTPALFAPRERAFALSCFGLSAGLASVIGPLLGGLLIGANVMGLTWRPIFLVNVPVGLLTVWLAWRYLPRLPVSPGLRIDHVGVLIGALALFCLITPLIEGHRLGWPLWCMVILLASLPLGALFLWWERFQHGRGAPELIPASLLANPVLHFGTALIALLFSGIPGFFLVLTLYLQNGTGLTPFQAGLITMPFSIGVLFASILTGSLGVKGPRLRIVVGALGLAGAMVWLRAVVLSTGETALWSHFAPPLLLGGMGLGLAISPIFQIVLAGISRQDSGSGSGTLQSCQQIGAALGVAIMSEIFFGRLGVGPARIADHAAYAQSFGAALYYNTFCFLAVALIVVVTFRTTLGETPPRSIKTV